MIEEDTIAFGHSEVHTVKPDFGEADVLQLGSREQHTRHAASLECHAREGGLSDICAREVISTRTSTGRRRLRSAAVNEECTMCESSTIKPSRSRPKIPLHGDTIDSDPMARTRSDSEGKSGGRRGGVGRSLLARAIREDTGREESAPVPGARWTGSSTSPGRRQLCPGRRTPSLDGACCRARRGSPGVARRLPRIRRADRSRSARRRCASRAGTLDSSTPSGRRFVFEPCG